MFSHCNIDSFCWNGYLIIYLVQIYSIIFQAGNHFTKNVGKAAFDLINLLMIGLTAYFIIMHSNLVENYFFQIMVTLGFVMARTISTTLVCSTS